MTENSLHTLHLSRRGLLRDAAAAAGVGAILAVGLPSGPALAGAFSQKMAKYQPTPKGAARCDNCLQFEAPSACKVVQGEISASGWCTLYAVKH